MAYIRKGEHSIGGYSEEQEIYSRLSFFSQTGVLLYVDNRKATPEEAARCHEVREDQVYMPDYVFDADGRLKELRYDRISCQ